MEQKRIGVTIGELIMAGLVVVSAVLTFWIQTSIRLNALELRMNTAEENYKKIDEKLDKQSETLNEIKLSLQNKQDRK